MHGMAAGGRGVARRADGHVVFVPGGLLGDKVRLKQVESKRRFSVATEWELVQASADRETVACPVAGNCGGCDWMGLKPAAQREGKRQIINDAVRRVGKLATTVLPVIQRGAPLHYRSRAKFHIDDQGRLGFRRSRSHEIVPVNDCVVCTSSVNEHLQWLQSLPSGSLTAWATAEVRAFSDYKPALHLVPKKRGTTLPSQLQILLSSAFHLSIGGGSSFVPGRLPALEDTDTSIKPWASPSDFTQVNWRVNRALIQALLHGVERHSVESFIDLYCGVGNFSFPLLQRGLRGLGLESNTSAISCAKHTCTTYGFDNGAFKATNVARELKRLGAQAARFDLVILDPPRAGAKDDIGDIARLAPRCIYYVSCDPVTFARDLAGFAEHGYVTSEVQPYDMFPQTHHVESTAWLVPIDV